MQILYIFFNEFQVVLFIMRLFYNYLFYPCETVCALPSLTLDNRSTTVSNASVCTLDTYTQIYIYLNLNVFT